MSETRDAFGPLLQRLQADMTSLRSDMRGLRAEQVALREYIVTFIGARAGETEAMLDANFVDVGRQFGLLNKRLDQTERSAEERLARIETIITTGH